MPSYAVDCCTGTDRLPVRRQRLATASGLSTRTAPSYSIARMPRSELIAWAATIRRHGQRVPVLQTDRVVAGVDKEVLPGDAAG